MTKWHGCSEVKHWLYTIMRDFCTSMEARRKSRSRLVLPCILTSFYQKNKFFPQSKTDGNKPQSHPTAAQREPSVQGFGSSSCDSCWGGICLQRPSPCRNWLQCRGLHLSGCRDTLPQRLHEESLPLDPTRACPETPQATGSLDEQECRRGMSGCHAPGLAKNFRSAVRRPAHTWCHAYWNIKGE